MRAAPIATRLTELRSRLEASFGLDTAAPGTISAIPSAGHCAAVAAIVYSEFGGELVSTFVRGQSHWFNRLRVGRRVFDVDLTGDQFGFDDVRVDTANGLFPTVRLRSCEQLNEETLLRALRLAERAELLVARKELTGLLASRHRLAA